MQRLSLASGIANLGQAKKLFDGGTLTSSDIAQCLIHLHTAAETLLRIYLTSTKGVPWKVRTRARESRQMSFPDLIQHMGRCAAPPFELGDILLSLNAWRNRAAHPHDTLLTINVSKLETLSTAANQLYATYADTIAPEWREAVLTPDEVSWVEVHPTAFRYYPSTEERRLVWIRDGTPLVVLPPGQHFPPLWRGVDHVGFVTLTPRRLRCEFESNVLSSDRIPLEAEVAIEVAIKDEEWAIKRVVVGATEQERLLRDAVCAAVTAQCVQHAYVDLLSRHDALSKDVVARLSQQLAALESAFRLIGVFVLRIEATDVGLAKEALERAQATERASTERFLLQHKRDLQRETAALEREQAEQHHALEAQRLSQQIDDTRRREELVVLELQLAALKENQDREIALRRAQIDRQIQMEEIMTTAEIGGRLDSENGRLAFFPKDVFELKKLELQQEIEREKYKAEIEKYKGRVQEEAVRRAFDLMNQEARSVAGFRAGQAQALLAVMARREQISLEEPPGHLRDGGAIPAGELPEGEWAREIAVLTRTGLEATIQGDTVAVAINATDKVEIQKGREGSAPKVWCIQAGGRSEADVSWWSPGMTLTEIVLRILAKTATPGV